MQSTCHTKFEGIHLAIIMDGNGRWAQVRGQARLQGHIRGSESVRAVVRAAPQLGIGVLTLYAFSSDNWGRPAQEVEGLMALLERYLRDELDPCRDNGVRLNVVGRRDRLNRRLREAIRLAEERTRGCRRLHLRIAIDYSAREQIVRAARLFAGAQAQGQPQFARCLSEVMHSSPPAPEVDLVIRTSGEKRLSDFLLWECAYAEMYFSDSLWPDFGVAELKLALRDFRGRGRRFGLISPPVSENRPSEHAEV